MVSSVYVSRSISVWVTTRQRRGKGKRALFLGTGNDLIRRASRARKKDLQSDERVNDPQSVKRDSLFKKTTAHALLRLLSFYGHFPEMRPRAALLQV